MAARDLRSRVWQPDATEVLDLVAAASPLTQVAPISVPFVDLVSEHADYRSELDEAIASVIDTSSFVLGEAVDRFEASFASYCATSHAVGVDSGFSALELILRAWGIGPGDEVITTANTFIATAGAIDATGATPVLVDVDRSTRSIDVEAVEAAVTGRTRAIIPVHLYGRMAPMAALLEVADRHGLKVLEDACQAHGARTEGRPAGSWGDAAAFSFYPSKNLGAIGDGGMVVTSDPALADRVRMLRNVGSAEKYIHRVRGFNRRLDSIHAAVLDVKLRRLDSANTARRWAAGTYNSLLDGLDLTLPAPFEGEEHVFHLYVIEVERREELQNHLRSSGIATGVHYPVPIHLQPAYQELGYGPGDFPVSERLARHILSLPMFPTIEAGQVAHVARAVRGFFEGGA
jgi:dTDP-4-amino-4,6-dideoxygalactose transaminase